MIFQGICRRSRTSSGSGTSEGLHDLFRVPQPMESEESWHRATHQDLEGKNLAELLMELERARLAILLLGSPPRWWLQRLERCRDHLLTLGEGEAKDV